MEVITCVKELQEGLIHQTVGYKVPDEQCDLDYVGNGNVKMDIKYALTNSLGFGGHNASYLLKSTKTDHVDNKWYGDLKQYTTVIL